MEVDHFHFYTTLLTLPNRNTVVCTSNIRDWYSFFTGGDSECADSTVVTANTGSQSEPTETGKTIRVTRNACKLNRSAFWKWRTSPLICSHNCSHHFCAPQLVEKNATEYIYTAKKKIQSTTEKKWQKTSAEIRRPWIFFLCNVDFVCHSTDLIPFFTRAWAFLVVFFFYLLQTNLE